MPDVLDVLCLVSVVGALIGTGGYVYGYIVRPRGDRRWQIASLLFSGLGLANLPTMLKTGVGGPSPLNAVLLVAFLFLSVACQLPAALRRRRSDRHRRAQTDAA